MAQHNGKQHSVAAYDLHRLVGFANSVAYAKAAAIGTSVKLESFSDNGIMNTLIMACTGEGGFANVEQDVKLIENQRERFARQFLSEILDQSAKGPRQLTARLAFLEKEKGRALQDVQTHFERARNINTAIDNRLRFSINTLASVKAASCLFLAAAPLGAAAVGGAGLAATAGGISFIFSVSKTLAKNLAEGNDASVVAFETGKELGKEGVSRGTTKAAALMTVQEQLFEEALRKVRSLSKSLEGAVKAKYIRSLKERIALQQGRMAGAALPAAAAPLARGTARAVPVVFAAMDTWDAITDFGNEWQR